MQVASLLLNCILCCIFTNTLEVSLWEKVYNYVWWNHFKWKLCLQLN